MSINQSELSLSVFGDLTKIVDPSWFETFNNAKDELDNIAQILDNDIKNNTIIYPEIPNVFRVFALVPLSSVKCVIVGQDPYPTGEATGVAFSADRSAAPLSLKRIYNCIKQYTSIIIGDDDSSLEGWCQQGVLLLNQSLTVKHGSAGSYHKRWSGFVVHVCKSINALSRTVPWAFWGSEARELESHVVSEYKFVTAHPASRNMKKNPFEGHKHFKQINDALHILKTEPIDWTKYMPV